MCLLLQLGGTVGDIESMPFIEAFRQFQFKVKRENFCNIHVSLIPQVWLSDDITPAPSPVVILKMLFVLIWLCELSPKLQESRKPNQPRAAFESSEVLDCLQTWWVRFAFLTILYVWYKDAVCHLLGVILLTVMSIQVILLRGCYVAQLMSHMQLVKLLLGTRSIHLFSCVGDLV